MITSGKGEIKTAYSLSLFKSGSGAVEIKDEKDMSNTLQLTWIIKFFSYLFCSLLIR